LIAQELLAKRTDRYMDNSDVRLERLVSQITDMIIARLGDGAAGGSECELHHDECFIKCPGRMRSIVSAGNIRLGVSGAESKAAREVARYIDHTLLKPEAARDDILNLCEEAARYGFASVCINPTWAREAACALRGSGVKVCTVIGFPLGAAVPDVKQYESRRAVFDGAQELDMVINIGALKSGDFGLVSADIGAVVTAAHEAGCITKVIIETALLTDDEKIKACVLAKEANADFVKTSTGFSKAGATVADIALMRRVVGGEMGVKAAGGVKDYQQAQEMIRAGATRIGASVGVKIVQEAAGAKSSTNGPPRAY
jgi:deoxyribose-phosphate aldolase